MRRWYLVVLGAYALLLLALILPLAQLGYGWDAFGSLKAVNFFETSIPFESLFRNGELLPFLLGWVGILVLIQAALLAVPVVLTRQKPVRKRSVWATVLASGLCMALLLGTLLLDLDLFLVGENDKAPLYRFGSEGLLWAILAVALLAWVGWAWVFYRSWRAEVSEDWVARICRFLLAGSILELLVAVPCHIASRRREDCCAHFGTFLGLATGTAVMLFSFGPGVLFLFAERMRRKRGG